MPLWFNKNDSRLPALLGDDCDFTVQHHPCCSGWGWTVFLNAQKRTGGIWLATTGLLVGGIFFATHTAMLGSTIEELILGVRSWWYFFFAPIVVLPFAWYLLMLWYAGFWDDVSSALHRRHRFGLVFTTILVIALIALLLIANPFGFNENSSVLRDLVRLGVRVFPIAAVLYPLFIFSCLGFALDALHRPAPSGRMMGDLARRRARPWLLAATLVQFVVSILVGAALSWLLLSFNSSSYGNIVYDSQQGRRFFGFSFNCAHRHHDYFDGQSDCFL